MLKPKKRITKHDLKEDKFVRFTLQAKNYVDENYQKIIRIALGIGALIIILVFYYYNSHATDEEANSKLGIAEIEYANGNMPIAQERLLKLVNEYDGTDAADKGMFLLANIYYQQKMYENARNYFGKFVNAYSGSNILLASGYAGLAACEEVNANFASAAGLYEQAAKLAPDFPESDNYAYLAAICYKRAGETEKARVIFEQLASKPKTSERENDAETQLVLLGNKLNAE
jgi:TolA-binding protein